MTREPTAKELQRAVRRMEARQRQKKLGASKEEEVHTKKEEGKIIDWTYTCECLEEGCGWRVAWENKETWKKGAASAHAGITGHRVRTTSIKIITPEQRDESQAKQPADYDKQTAYCTSCKRYIGAGAGRWFAASWRAHQRATGHAITVMPNPAYVKGK